MRAVLAALCLALASPALAADADRTRALLIDDDLPGWIESYVNDMGGDWSLLPFDDMSAAADAVPRHFQPDAIFDEIVAAAAGALSDADLDAILAWRATPAGAGFTAADRDYENSDCGRGADSCGDALARMEITDDPRLDAIRAVSATGGFAEIELAIEIAILQAAWQAGAPLPEGADPADIPDILRSYAAMNHPDLARWHEALSAEIYAPFSAENIAAYADFLATPAARTYLIATGKALRDALAIRAAGLSRELAARPPTRGL